MLPGIRGRVPLGLIASQQAMHSEEPNGTHPSKQSNHQQQQQQRQEEQEVANAALRMLLSTNSSSSYATALLRPLHMVSDAGRAAALRTINHLKLVRCRKVPYSRQLSVLTAATSATALTIGGSQIAGLLEACEQHQLAADLAALGATLNTILAMEGSCRGAPYVTANSTSSGAPNATTSKGRGSTAAMVIPPIPPPPAAAKRQGPHLERILVAGDVTPAMVQQLVQLLDVLPGTQHLRHLASRDYPADDQCQVRWDDATIQPRAPWRQGYLHAIHNDDNEEHAYRWLHDDSSSGSGGSGSGSSGSGSSEGSGSRGSGSGIGSCRRVQATGAADASSWRSSCHVVQWWHTSHDPLHVDVLQPLLEALQQVRGLYLPGLHLWGLPKCTAYLQQLESLDLHFVTGVDFPGTLRAVAGLTNLRSLGITNCGLTHIPAAFTALVRLTHLDLSVTNVTSDGLECLGDMSSLRELELCRCSLLTSLPNSMRKLAKLETLVLRRTTFLHLPVFLTSLPQLRNLSWSSVRSYTTRPMHLESLWRLTGLQQLVLEEANIPALPRDISCLTGLTGLLVQAERLTHPPTSLSALVGLERLGINAPRLVNLPDAITTLTKLTRIVMLCEPRMPLSPAVAAFVEPRRWMFSNDEE